MVDSAGNWNGIAVSLWWVEPSHIKRDRDKSSRAGSGTYGQVMTHMKVIGFPPKRLIQVWSRSELERLATLDRGTSMTGVSAPGLVSFQRERAPYSTRWPSGMCRQF